MGTDIAFGAGPMKSSKFYRGLTETQYIILESFNTHWYGKALFPYQIAKRTKIPISGIYVHFDNLYRLGMVVRTVERGAKNKIRSYYKLTPEGRAIFKATEVIQDLFANLNSKRPEGEPTKGK